ncbi:MAG: 4-hydroxy-3-methylbut-2-enyl diphosphate reductase [Desulfamplus sp.]|nr:4-hydroxy-3-methylbut-2-enyl diphosphate reductase [Desulfamplus sp.]
MKITIAKTAGFCMGVRRAVDMVLDAANKTCDPICTYGPLIHNPQVLQMLEEKGIPTINKIPEKGEGTVLIRAHGVPPQEQKALKNAGFRVINATCPRVIRVQTIIRKHAAKGFVAIIIGDQDHPEVKGLMGYAQTVNDVKDKIGNDGQQACVSDVKSRCSSNENGRSASDGKDRSGVYGQESCGYTVSTIEELAVLPGFDKAIIVAQTTQDTVLYHEVKEWISQHYPHYKIFDTICDSTEKRQAETRRIAKESDVVVVVGGKDSGNTRRLAQVAAETVSNRPNKASFAVHIEDVSELDMGRISWAHSIAITAGASTPNWTINQTLRSIENELEKGKNSPVAFMRRIRNFLLRSNLILSAGAGSLTYACSKIQGIDHNLIHAFISMLYILSMQILNNLFSIKSDKYNNPERAEFYDSNKVVLAVVAIISGAAGLCLSYTTGILSFVLLSFMSLLGLLYNQKIFPDFFPSFYFLERRITRIKDIPGSKTILIAAAWGTVTSLLPALSTTGQSVVLENSGSITMTASGTSILQILLATLTGISFIIPFVFSTSIVFARTAFFAILEIQGDRITGKETIPIILGEKKSLELIRNMLLLAFATLFISGLSGFVSMSGMLIACIPLSILYVIKSHEKGKITPGMDLELIIESHFLVAGIMAVFLNHSGI